MHETNACALWSGFSQTIKVTVLLKSCTSFLLHLLFFFTSDINKIHLGIGDKMGTFIQWMAGFFAGFAIGFAYGWKLTLVILAISPLLAGVAILMSKVIILLLWDKLNPDSVTCIKLSRYFIFKILFYHEYFKKGSFDKGRREISLKIYVA